jgi:hypothetical protein
MRVCVVPFFEINLGIVVALFFFRIALPRLIRLFMGALIRLLSRVVFSGLSLIGIPPPLNRLSYERGCGS